MIMWGIDYATYRPKNRAPQLRNNVKAWMRSVNWGCLCLLAYLAVVIVGLGLLIWRVS